MIEHPPGEEVQWDWLELPDPPEHWQAGRQAHLLVGCLPASGRWRALLAEGEDQAHLVEALHAVSARLGGLPQRWRLDRMATVCHPASGRVTASFAAVAKHYGVHVDICRPGTATARAASRSPTTPRCSAGGARCPMSCPSRRRRRRWTRSAPASATHE